MTKDTLTVGYYKMVKQGKSGDQLLVLHVLETSKEPPRNYFEDDSNIPTPIIYTTGEWIEFRVDVFSTEISLVRDHAEGWTEEKLSNLIPIEEREYERYSVVAKKYRERVNNFIAMQ